MDETSFEGALASSRMLPALTEANRTFWQAGREGKLMLQRCGDCDRFVSPTADACPGCAGELAYEQVSGRGRVFTFTVTHQPYNPAVPVPYVVALVELDEQEGLRLFTNVIGIEPERVRIGLEVEVRFEDHGEIFVPVFAPAA
jgi:uncharacterized OB-fold protein